MFGAALDCRAGRPPGRGAGADLSVAQAVVDQGEQFAGHRDGGGVTTTPFGDAGAADGEPIGMR